VVVIFLVEVLVLQQLLEEEKTAEASMDKEDNPKMMVMPWFGDPIDIE